MRKSYEQLMTEVRAGWSEADHELSGAALEYFDRVHREVFQLGEQLAARRTALGLTQRELAKISGVQQAELSRIERGSGNPTWSTVQRLSAALALDVQFVAR